MTARRVDGVTVERAADEILAYNPSTDEVHALNAAAALVFELCDGTNDVDAMTRCVSERLGLPDDADIVLLALDELEEAGLVEREVTVASVGRRALIKRFGLVAATVAALPVVESIVLPHAAAASSPGPSPTPSPLPTPTPAPE